LEGGPYDPTTSMTPTNTGNMDDFNNYTVFTQTRWIVGTADHQDWSAPGHQYMRASAQAR